MADRENVIKGLECCIKKHCNECPYKKTTKTEPWQNDCNEELTVDILALLKEREAVKPMLDKQTGRLWLCGKCGSYVGFEDSDPHDPNEFDKYCRECGRPVLWEGR